MSFKRLKPCRLVFWVCNDVLEKVQNPPRKCDLNDLEFHLTFFVSTPTVIDDCVFALRRAERSCGCTCGGRRGRPSAPTTASSGAPTSATPTTRPAPWRRTAGAAAGAGAGNSASSSCSLTTRRSVSVRGLAPQRISYGASKTANAL